VVDGVAAHLRGLGDGQDLVVYLSERGLQVGRARIERGDRRLPTIRPQRPRLLSPFTYQLLHPV